MTDARYADAVAALRALASIESGAPVAENLETLKRAAASLALVFAAPEMARIALMCNPKTRTELWLALRLFGAGCLPPEDRP